MKKILLILILSGFAITAASASDSKTEIDKNVLGDFALWVNHEIDDSVLLDNLIAYDFILSEMETSWWSLYWKAKIAIIQGQIYHELGEKEKSIEQLEKSLEFARESISISERSDTWRIMSEASSLIMLQKGMIYILANFSNAQEQANIALEIDKNNSRASLVIARFLCSAPAIAGGNLSEGIAIMDSLLLKDDLSELDRFLILKSLSEILFEEKRWNEAERYCREAIGIFPGNQYCRDLLTELQSKI